MNKRNPGLGSKIAEKKFAGQFVGLNAYQDQFKLQKDGGEIDAVTGATISSRAVIDAVQKAVQTYKSLTQEQPDMKNSTSISNLTRGIVRDNPVLS